MGLLASCDHVGFGEAGVKGPLEKSIRSPAGTSGHEANELPPLSSYRIENLANQ